MQSYIHIMHSSLPAYKIADKVNTHLQSSSTLVITAPPGAGKSTLLPLTILEGLHDEGRIIMLEPRRLAARQIAERMAEMIGEPVGRTVGYRIRFDNCTSQHTRIEVVTEGILTRMLIDDPTLEGISAVIFDEFHERSLTSDVSLALTRETQSIIRPDLKIIIMSATIDAASICASLEAPLVESEGRMFDVDIRYLDSSISENSRTDDIATEVVRTIVKAHREHQGDILVFLPGQAEIMRCEEMLASSLGSTNVYPLYGLLSPQQQRRAIAPSREGERKVVLATSIAETSLTIQGVRIVIDSGLYRKMVFTPQNGLSHLTTARISRDMATQRAGRAGRIAEGVCYRLWSLATEHRMDENRSPEILDADLAPMVLDIASWGERNVAALSWLTPPPTAHVAQATELLNLLGAFDNKHIASLPCHPRIANMLGKASSDSLRSLAADMAAILESRDPMASENDADINSRIIELRHLRADGTMNNNSNRYALISKLSAQYHRLLKVQQDNSVPSPASTGHLLSLAYPERVARASSEGFGTYRMASGDTSAIDGADELSACEWIVVASFGSRIFLASPVNIDDLQPMMQTLDNLSWDNRQGIVLAQRERRIGRILVDSRPIHDISQDDIIRTLCEAAPKYGQSMFTFDDKVQGLQRRIALVSQWHPELHLPDVTTEAVLRRASDWLLTTDLKKVDMTTAIWSLLTYEQQQDIDRLAPTHIQVPTGSRIRVEYRQGAELPILRVRLQECFGLTDTPRIDGGRQGILLELLSPGFKPVQLTQDLRSFWNDTYFEVRKELRRRYPKHYWPDNPLEAEATRSTRKNNSNNK